MKGERSRKEENYKESLIKRESFLSEGGCEGFFFLKRTRDRGENSGDLEIEEEAKRGMWEAGEKDKFLRKGGKTSEL